MREPLSTGLRLVEDIPELVIGGLDLSYFGGAWCLGVELRCLAIAWNFAIHI